MLEMFVSVCPFSVLAVKAGCWAEGSLSRANFSSSVSLNISIDSKGLLIFLVMHVDLILISVGNVRARSRAGKGGTCWDGKWESGWLFPLGSSALWDGQAVTYLIRESGKGGQCFSQSATKTST